MIPARVHSAILRTAAFLVPQTGRADWLAEWRSELWHIRRHAANANVTAFCLGAFRDALWLRRNACEARPGSVLRLDAPSTPAGIESFPDGGEPALSRPAHCLGFLTGLAALSLAAGFIIPAARPVLASLWTPGNVVMLSPGSRGADYPNGFVAPWPSVSRKQFESLRARSGSQFTSLEFNTPKQTANMGFVVGRLRNGTLNDARFCFVRVRDRSIQFLSILVLAFPFAAVFALGMPMESAGRRLSWHGPRKALFLAAKVALVVPTVVFGSLDLDGLRGAVSPLCFDIAFFGGVFAMRWMLADQRRRCPVCLRLLANPVRLGESSHILLEWHGTELMCARGHGLLYVPEWPAIWSPRQRWIGLGASWNGFFRQ
jgi:hypothetical protein